MKHAVLELTGSFQLGGSERQAVQLAKMLNDEGSFRVFVGCLDRTGDLDSELSWLSSEEIPEFKLTSFYDRNFLRQVSRCATFIKTHDIDVVHTHDFYTNIFGMCAAYWAGVPARVASKRETFSKTEKQMLIERQAFRLADRIVANANAVKEFLVTSGVPEGKITVIHNGLDMERLTPAGGDRRSVLDSLGLGRFAHRQIVTIVANMSSEVKNHGMFLRTAKTVLDAADAAFVLAGEGELTESLKTLARELGIDQNVAFIGRCGNVADLLSVSDVCVLSSRSEGFSNSILEYMAAGKPVVATRVGGAAEVVIENETGFLVDDDDDKTMAARITMLVHDRELAGRLGEHGRAMIENGFTLGRQLAKTLDVYRTVLASKAPRAAKAKTNVERSA